MPGIKGIGRLDRRITIQEEVVETNDYNEPELTGWDDVCTVYAKVEDHDARGGEVFSSDQVTAKRATLFTIRYRSGITEKMRILYDERYYGIVSITEPIRRTTTLLRGMLLDET